MQHGNFFRALFLCLLLSACTKETDERSPVIEYIFPYEGHRYQHDEIRLTVRISDNKQLKAIRFGLVDYNYIPIIQAVPLNVIATDTVIDYTFFLDIPASQFKLFVQASDGFNTKNKYLNVSKNVPETRKSGLLFLEDNGGSFGLRRLAGEDGAVVLATINRKIVQVCDGGNTGLVYSLSDYPSGIFAHDFGTGALKWSYEAPMPESRINYMTFHTDKLIVAEKSGIIRLLHALNGQTLAVNQNNMDNEPLMVISDGDYVYSWQRSKISQQKTLGIFYAGTLSMFRSIHVDDHVIGMFVENHNSIILAHYNGNALKVNRIYKDSQQVQSLYDLQVPNLLRLKPISSNTLLLVCTTNLSTLHLTNGSIVPIINQEHISDGIIHEGNVCFSSGNKLHYHGTGSFTFQGKPTFLTDARYIND